jgi:hypothetical protein
LTAVIPAAFLVQPVAAVLIVEAVDLDGNVSARSHALEFPVTAVAPFVPCSGLCISALSPTMAIAGSGDLTLVVTGTGFFCGNRVSWAPAGGAPIHWLSATMNSGRELTTVIPAALLASPGLAQVSVDPGDPKGDGDGSNAIEFTISQAGVNP